VIVTYEEACILLGWDGAILPMDETTQGWLVKWTTDIIDRLGVEGLDSFEGMMLKDVFEGRFPPELLKPGERDA
jgi:hypothetical protein